MVTTDDVPAGRPAPCMIFRAMERCRVQDVSRVIAVGDTAVDVQAGRNAGATAVGVLTGQTGRALLAAAGPDHILDSVADIPALVVSAPVAVRA
ncbi:HAD hydrolase-like protein [Gordonia alkaliphila]|nr:HAD hydrolase-like protein [Gordonia alkaliphila]MCK0440646.1 HAD hydrolase-like protein [Gordonia alkaliphila]